MDKKKLHDFKEDIERRVDPQHRGCLHTLFFRVIVTMLAVFLIFAIYNCVVSGHTSEEEIQEERAAEEERAALLDTFDVVGDYIFPAQKASREDLLTDEEREKAKNKNKKSEEPEKVLGENSGNDIVESADITSDPKPLPSTPAQPAPQVEKMESPKVAPIEP